MMNPFIFFFFKGIEYEEAVGQSIPSPLLYVFFVARCRSVDHARTGLEAGLKETSRLRED